MIKDLLKINPLYTKVYRPWREKKNKQQLDYRRAIFQENGICLLEKFVTLMTVNDIPYWFEFGSLLGAYRDKDFIKNDFDFDFGVYLKDSKRIYETLTRNGFKLIREFHVRGENGLEQTYEYMGITVDFFYFYEQGDILVCNGFYNAINQKIGEYFDICVSEFYFKKFSIISYLFKGITVSVPDNIERHIIEVYGEGYKVYDPNFKDGLNKVKYPKEEKIGCGYFLR